MPHDPGPAFRARHGPGDMVVVAHARDARSARRRGAMGARAGKLRGRGHRVMRGLALILMLWAAPLAAQGWPDWQTTTVTDLADLLPPEAEARVTAHLTDLKARTGIELAVLTLERQADWQPDLTLEDFGRGVFDRWGIGDASRNDGILVMVLAGDRAMRITLGAGYDRYWDRTAETVVDDHFLPEFRRGDYAAGIEAGVAELIRAVAEPFAAKAPPPAREGPPGWWLLAVAGMAMLIARRWLGDRIGEWRRCPSCGRRGLRIRRQTVTPPDATTAGTGERATTCPHCDWSDRRRYAIPVSRSQSGFGGGRSGGGGASGRW